MLILTRRVGEVIMIGDDIKVTIRGVRQNYLGNVVLVGFDAPENVIIHREEVYNRIALNKKIEDIELDDIVAECIAKRNIEDILRKKGARYGV